MTWGLVDVEEGRTPGASWPAERHPRLGIVTNVHGLFSYASVKASWRATIDLLSHDFPTVVYHAESFDVDCDSPEYRSFVSAADLLVLLSPYFRLNRHITEVPAIVLALGSMQKGGHWLYWNQDTYRAYDSVVLNCTACRCIYDQIVGQSGLQPAFLPPPIDGSIFYPRGDRLRTRQQYDLPVDAFILIYAGRINLQKGCHVLLKVLSEVRKRHNVHLVLLGFYDNYYIPEFSEQSPPDCQTALQAIIRRYDLSAHVTVIDYQDDPAKVPEIMSACDVGMNLGTLINENFGLAPVEMQLCELPVICSHWGGMKDTILHGETGFQADTILSRCGPRVNYEQAVHFLDQLIMDPDLRAQMGRNGRLRAEKYTLPYLAAGFRNLIYRTVRQRETLNPCYRFAVNPVFERFYKSVAEHYGTPRDLAWEHLRPSMDFETYRLIARECATAEADAIEWSQESGISKAFDWEMPQTTHWRSLDPRWNPGFELVDFTLTEDELWVLWQIEQGNREVDQLARAMGCPRLSHTLQSLAAKGLILPADSLVERKLAAGAAKVSARLAFNK